MFSAAPFLFSYMKHALICFLLLCSSHLVKAQIPFELFAGEKKTSLDLMFFKFLKPINDSSHTTNPRWLFFNRNRAVVDYKMTSSAFKPQFGFTEAISYNHEKWKGLAPVMVGQILNTGAYAKAGMQFARVNKHSTIFTWIVSELTSSPYVDYFLLWRYTPALSKRINGFIQIELINAFPTASDLPYNFTQRLRLGLKRNSYQCGIGADINTLGRTSYTSTYNFGIFLRHEF